MELSSSSSSSLTLSDRDPFSSDEEDLNLLGAVAMQRVFRAPKHPFEYFNDVEFQKRYRLQKQTVMRLVNHIGQNIEPVTRRNQSITAINQILITLRFLATGSFYILLGDDMNVHKSTTCRIIKKVVPQIAALHDRYIFMPRNAVEIAEIKTDFHSIAGFPSVIGCIDGTHVKIQSPGGEHAERYRNRKHYFSYNVQAVCNKHLRIMSIDARWPGSTHDSTVFSASSLNLRFIQGEYTNCFLLADGAYQQKKFILTPILNPQNNAEERYNTAHIRTRNCIERCFGVLKRRFPVLALGFRTKQQTTLAAVVAAAVLHNLAIEEKEDIPAMEIDAEFDDPVPTEDLPDNQGNAVRAAIVQSVFR